MIHPVVVNPVLSPVVRVTDPVRWRAGKLAPADSILHWDADIDAFAEQTGGPHTFNHAVLSPQYQRNADGSYSNVGAKPAVDTFDGEKWLRSCGAVTNLLPSGAEVLTTWSAARATVHATGVLTPQGDAAYSVAANSELANHKVYKQVAVPVGSYTVRLLLKKDTTRYVAVSIANQVESSRIAVLIDFDLKTISLVSGSGRYSIEEQEDGWFLLNLSCDTISGDISAAVFVYVRANSGESTFTGTTEAALVGSPQLTATSYPVPYVPPGVTQPASNATTTNGVWFTLPDGSPLWQALTGQPFTLATRVRMGVGSEDLVLGSLHSVLNSAALVAGLLHTRARVANAFTLARIHDGTNGVGTPEVSGYPRNTILRQFAQVSAYGTHFRVGHMIEGTHTAIQWSSWVNYDGSFNPSTLYRLMLGYDNAYPMWFNKITAWKKQATDAEILEAMSA